ncbi:bifunctional serine/threonine-protein kinase/ABC transporter substrate-binding protein [Nodularia sphaerocarpa]|uniref:bifunctional serine/threonine-protein kinase/ABC transporter substrate-binding protein n=1 Tax=Nodularia sphaerocarpa TaxID=137816 RepID=UPI001EFA75FE|nr:bifunctional serine/threonine-protein kinase/ABC transporter substrate-binding protein [Nodularia sphaerocarpa]MDB9373838.1 bifunctional serine/threonine-protein kinase/ABC transporter substrate-binding protein [Nodularia sphaerocarpa CS-585]MDB9380401.1 bifunctional serine/threonine-protein kinase/ABC transporter substrate-binding protein [Nodularia sphaerocarpa CS-585A2]ULP72854.1 Serine/threonine-protein kinase F [Nodularia sphaerocarpa UHCC 0038]
MVNTDSSIKVYCTRPSCDQPVNSISQEALDSRFTHEIRCSNCGMPLILDGRFLPLRLLVPEKEQGGLSRTFLGQDLSSEKELLLVIKQLHPRTPNGQTLSPSKMQRIEELFEREANILKELEHPQIPRPLAFFVVEADPIKYPPKFFYLIQDYIEGENLFQILKKKRKFSEDEVIHILKEILKILTYIHKYKPNLGAIHRDIKPANIMRCQSDEQLYLIDFGAVKQVIEGLPAEIASIVLTPAFAPPEQWNGRKVSPASDLYALAATCVCLLTGDKNPRELVLNSNWKDQAKVSDHFANVLDSMLKYEQEDRPQSAQEVLDTLEPPPVPTLPPNQSNQSNPPNPPNALRDWLKKVLRKRRLISLGCLALFGVAIAIISPIIKNLQPQPLAVYFSRGEQALLNQDPATSLIPECTNAYNLKEQGIAAFKNASDSNFLAGFKQAEVYLQQAHDKFKKTAGKTAGRQNKCEVDPETLIYYYNAKAAQTPSARTLPTIAVVIPSDSKSIGKEREILRGVAQAQGEQKPDSPVFQIIIVKVNNDELQDNSDKPTEFTEIVTKLSKKKNNIPGDPPYFKDSQIIGVVGHYTSGETWYVGRIYQKEKLVLISPISTAVRGTNPNNSDIEYVFRTASNDSIAARDLANYYLKNRPQQGKILIVVFESESQYSLSLKEQFAATFTNPTSLDYCDLSIQTNPNDCIQKATAANVQTLMLATSLKQRKTALEITKAAKEKAKLENRDLQLLGGDSLYDNETFEVLGQLANDMVVAVPFHADPNTNFTKKATELWSTGQVSWRTLTSYDAAQSFLEAITKLRLNGINPTREEVYQTLTTISAPGATQVVEFDHDHDRKQATGVGILVKANADEKRFTHLYTPQR